MKFAILSLGSLIIIGCSSHRPYIDVAEQSYQPKLNAAHHWQLMAKGAAEQLHASKKSIRIEMEAESPFSEVYKGLLLEELTSKGYTISDSATQTLTVDYTVIHHGATEEQHGLVKNTGKGIQHLFTGDSQGKYSTFGRATGTEHEVITSHKIANNGSIEDAYTAITYIPESDILLYSPEIIVLPVLPELTTLPIK